MQQITSNSDVSVKKNIIDRIGYVPGGVSLVISTLVAGVVVPEASPLSAPSSGKRTICKQAKLESGSNTTTFPVLTGTHHFKVGDQLCTKEGGKSYAITSITTSNGVDTITVGTAIDAQSDGWIYEGAAEAASTGSVFKNQPDAILKEAFEVPSTSQVAVFGDALLFASVAEDSIAPAYLAKLPTIKVVKY